LITPSAAQGSARIVSSSSAFARAALERTLKTARGAALDEVASKKLAPGLRHPVSKEEIAQTAPDCREDRQKIGFPVVRQGSSARSPAQIRHRRRGAGHHSPAEVRKAVQRHHRKVKKLKNKPKLEGILIARKSRPSLSLS